MRREDGGGGVAAEVWCVKDGGADREEFKNRGGGGGPAQPYFGTDGGRERC